MDNIIGFDINGRFSCPNNFMRLKIVSNKKFVKDIGACIMSITAKDNVIAFLDKITNKILMFGKTKVLFPK